jgi:hypothetical protein
MVYFWIHNTIQYIQLRLFTVQGTPCTQRAKYVVSWSRSGSRGVARAPPQALASEETRSEVDLHWRSLLALWVPLLWRLEVDGPECAKPLPKGWEKTVPGRSLSCSWYDQEVWKWDLPGFWRAVAARCGWLGHRAGTGWSATASRTA